MASLAPRRRREQADARLRASVARARSLIEPYLAAQAESRRTFGLVQDDPELPTWEFAEAERAKGSTLSDRALRRLERVRRERVYRRHGYDTASRAWWGAGDTGLFSSRPISQIRRPLLGYPWPAGVHPHMNWTLASAANWTADFGEFVAFAPAALTIGLYLVLDRRRNAALAWIASLVISLVLAAFLKAIHAPVSGHAAVAVAILGGCAILMWRDAFALGAVARLLSVPLALLAAGVCVSVLYLKWHTVADVACGILVGAIAPVILSRVRLEPSQRHWRGAAALMVVAALVGALHGVRLDDRVTYHIQLTVERIALAWFQRTV